MDPLSKLLIVECNKVVLNILPYYGLMITWLSKWPTRDHLSSLVHTHPSSIDFKFVERVLNFLRGNRIRFHCYSSRTPTLMFSMQEHLKKHQVFPVQSYYQKGKAPLLKNNEDSPQTRRNRVEHPFAQSNTGRR